MLTKKKKVFILFGMVALLVLTGVLNIVLNRMNTDANADDANGEQNGDFFAMYRAMRIADRQETLAILDSVINNPASSQSEIDEANAKKIAIASSSEKELEVESLIKARGFSDAVVTNTTENVNIIVKASELNTQQVAQIQDIVQTALPDKPLDVVTIIPVEG
ncbi:MAG: SpoIIIAH-like family protein [Firmicutes bacterium]|nr:SpoIIIAH-like family protein [Bacillota bacterium]